MNLGCVLVIDCRSLLDTSFLQPGNCLGLIGAKSGPTAVRGQFYGFAAAVGKIGAFIGTWGMCIMVIFTLPLDDHYLFA